jgi:hypothetical protein
VVEVGSWTSKNDCSSLRCSLCVMRTADAAETGELFTVRNVSYIPSFNYDDKEIDQQSDKKKYPYENERRIESESSISPTTIEFFMAGVIRIKGSKCLAEQFAFHTGCLNVKELSSTEVAHVKTVEKNREHEACCW